MNFGTAIMKKKFNRLEKFINILVEHESNNPKDLFPPAIDT